MRNRLLPEVPLQVLRLAIEIPPWVTMARFRLVKLITSLFWMFSVQTALIQTSWSPAGVAPTRNARAAAQLLNVFTVYPVHGIASHTPAIDVWHSFGNSTVGGRPPRQYSS